MPDLFDYRDLVMLLVMFLKPRVPALRDVWNRVLKKHREIADPDEYRRYTAFLFMKASLTYWNFCRTAASVRGAFSRIRLCNRVDNMWPLNQRWLVAPSGAGFIPVLGFRALMEEGEFRVLRIRANRRFRSILHWVEMVWTLMNDTWLDHHLNHCLMHIFDEIFDDGSYVQRKLLVFCIIHIALSITMQISGWQGGNLLFPTVRRARDSGLLAKFKFWSRIVAVSIHGDFQLQIVQGRQRVRMNLYFRDLFYVNEFNRFVRQNLH